ncbi:hypothetical protein [Kitasatospora sp. NPDC054795]
MPETPEYAEPIEPTAGVTEANRKVSTAVGAVDEKGGRDFADADRFMIAPPNVPAIYARREPQKVVRGFSTYDFLADSDPGSVPPTANGSLWRQGQLAAVAGLFHVSGCRAYRVYQVRGYDLSNMTSTPARRWLGTPGTCTRRSWTRGRRGRSVPAWA